MIPIFPVVSSENSSMSIAKSSSKVDDHPDSVDITILAPPPTACVLDHPIQLSPVKDASSNAENKEDEKCSEEEPTGKSSDESKETGKHQSLPLRKKTSFWNYFRPGASTEKQDAEEQKGEKSDTFVTVLETKLKDATNEDQTQLNPSNQEAQEEVQSENEKQKPPLRRQASMMSLAFSIPWTKRTRRLTDSSMYSSSNALASSGIPSRSSTMESRNLTNDGQVTPSQLCHADEMHGHQLAEEIVKFAHARHTIKTTKEIETLRTLATDLESAFRHQIDKVAVLHAQLENVHWRQHDLQDENRHLRFQMLGLNEQLVQQNAQIEALQQTVKTLSEMGVGADTIERAVGQSPWPSPVFKEKGKAKAEDPDDDTSKPLPDLLDDDQAVLFSAGIILNPVQK